MTQVHMTREIWKKKKKMEIIHIQLWTKNFNENMKGSFRKKNLCVFLSIRCSISWTFSFTRFLHWRRVVLTNWWVNILKRRNCGHNIARTKRTPSRWSKFFLSNWLKNTSRYCNSSRNLLLQIEKHSFNVRLWRQ